MSIALQRSDKVLSINFFHEKDLFPVFGYEKNCVTARFYRAISQISTDENFNKFASIQYTQADKRAIKINLPGKSYRPEIRIGKTHSSINLYSEKEPLKVEQKKRIIHTYLNDKALPVISIPCCFESIAAFKRGDELWIAMTGDVKSLEFSSKDKIKFRQISSENGYIIACNIGKLECQKLQYGPNQTAEILLTQDLAQEIKQNDIQYEELKDLHLWRIFSDYKICRAHDLSSKEHCTIVTIKDFVFGSNQTRIFEDFHVQKSLQGLVFVSKCKELPVLSEANQVSIKKTESESVPLASDLPWYFEGNFLSQKLELESALNSSDSSETRYLCTKRLAMLYFSKGHYHEADHLLNRIKDTPSFAKEAQVQLLHTVAKYMINDADSAQKTIDLISINNREILFWRNIICKNNSARSFLFDLESFVSEYHDEVYWKLTFEILEQHLRANKLSDTKELLSKIRSPETKDQQEKLLYYKAMLHYQMGNKTYAYKILEELESKPVQNSNVMMLKTSLTKIRYQDQKISLSEAISALEMCKTNRYDNHFERNLLMLLADLYHEQNDLISELRTLKYIKDFLDSDPLRVTPCIEALYEQIFFNKDFLHSFEPLKRLALLYEFKDPMPTGTDSIDLSIASNSLDLDLLDEAEEILEHQIKYRATGLKKESLVQHLACLLLINNKQEKALSLLDTQINENTSFEKHEKRLRLKSIAALLSNEWHLSLKCLEHDKSKESFIIKKEIFFRGRKWRQYIDLVEPSLLSLVKSKNSQISKELEQDILRFGICCMMLKENDLLQMFAKEIEKIDSNISANLVNLASTKPLTTYQKIADIQKINQLNDLLKSYKSEFLSTNY